MARCSRVMRSAQLPLAAPVSPPPLRVRPARVASFRWSILLCLSSSETAPVGVPVAAVPVAAGFGLGIGALLAGLVAVAGIAAVLLSGNDDGTLPISPD